MHSTRYLQRLTDRLGAGIRRLPEEVRERHRAYLCTQQSAEGAFVDREGGADLYYTGFGLRALAILDALTPEVSGGAAGYLRASLASKATVVDFYSLLYSCLLLQVNAGIDLLADSPADWPQRVSVTLESFRVADGGYGKATGANAGSTYHTFLVGLCHELLQAPLPHPQEMVAFIHTRRREDGGFVEIGAQRKSGTNPTAAAIGLLQLVEEDHPGTALSAEVREGVIDFLCAMQSSEGGFTANTRAPLADLLSTFTSLWTLDQLGALDQIDRQAALAYVRAIERPEGGFHGGVWDEGHDVEYTFYGLGVLALLHP